MSCSIQGRFSIGGQTSAGSWEDLGGQRGRGVHCRLEGPEKKNEKGSNLTGRRFVLVVVVRNKVGT